MNLSGFQALKPVNTKAHDTYDSTEPRQLTKLQTKPYEVYKLKTLENLPRQNNLQPTSMQSYGDWR